MKVYLSGPMTGIKNYNKEAFANAEVQWRENGHDVFNPYDMSIVHPHFTYQQYMGIDLKMLCDCDAIALLPGWNTSKGCRIEVYTAIKLGLRIYDATSLDELEISEQLFFTVTTKN